MDTEFLDKNIGNNGLVITDEIRSYLKEVAKWGKFLSIVGLVSIVLMIILALFMGLFMGSAMDAMGGGANAGVGFMSGTFLAAIYIIIGILYVMPVLYLYRFSTKLKVALANDNQEVLNNSFMNLKSLFKFMGILTVIVIILYALMFLIGGIGAIFAG